MNAPLPSLEETTAYAKSLGLTPLADTFRTLPDYSEIETPEGYRLAVWFETNGHLYGEY